MGDRERTVQFLQETRVAFFIKCLDQPDSTPVTGCKVGHSCVLSSEVENELRDKPTFMAYIAATFTFTVVLHVCGKYFGEDKPKSLTHVRASSLQHSSVITYLRTSWSSVLLEKLTGFAAN